MDLTQFLLSLLHSLSSLDFDSIRGWHVHPVENPESHYDINFMAVEDIINALSEAWRILP